ncbi:MAG: serine protease, partial [Desulfobacterales bacterium]|nr:serine protease [Desulfobacterales bacterium]
GFFVLRPTEEGKGKLFLVSNKHVLMPKSISPENVSKLATALVYITTEENSNLSMTNFPVILRKEDGTDMCVGHPNEKVDVAVMEVTPYVVENETIRGGYKVGFIRESRFSTKETIKETSLTIGDRIVVLGYPLNMLEGSTAVALARGGTIATPADRDYRKSPVFLIDCSTIRGSSGSPVFVPVRPYKVERKADGKVQLSSLQGYVPELLGIVSATISDWELILKKTVTFGAEPQTVSVMDTANLGIVFRADTISETIDATGIKRYIENDQN